MKSFQILLTFFMTLSLFSIESCHSPVPRNVQERKIAQLQNQDQNQIQYYEHRTQSNINPKRAIKDLKVSYQDEDVVKLSHARVLIADYELLKKDFPILKKMSNPEIDQWLIDQTGYVSIPQSEQQVVNSAIPTKDLKRVAHRPKRYNRALIFDAQNPHNPKETIGLLDVKGVGSLSPAQKDHGNGVATLGEVIREFIYERAMREVVYDSGIENKIVGSYAVIDPGFDVIHENGSHSPAGYYIRQGHDRWVAANGNDWLK